jgi:Ca2+-binding EF-hand superfamily protein
VYKEFYPHGKAEKYCVEVFKVFDTDNSGKIDFVEFLVAVSITSSTDIRKKLQLAFDLYDKNDNGRIDKKEMEKMLTSIYDLMGETNRKVWILVQLFFNKVIEEHHPSALGFIIFRK